MPKQGAENTQAAGSTNWAAPSELEARLRHFFEKQRRLRALLDETLAEAGLAALQEIDAERLRELADQTRADLDRLNSDLARLQDAFCADAAHEEEYNRAIEKVLGFDPRIDVNEVEAILAGKSGCDMKQFIEGLKRKVKAMPA